MKFFVDTADVAAIKELNDLGMVDGVTTNPSLILKSGRDIREVTKEICSIVEGPVSAEVVALKAEEMIAEGKLSNYKVLVAAGWSVSGRSQTIRPVGACGLQSQICRAHHCVATGSKIDFISCQSNVCASTECPDDCSRFCGEN